MAFDRNKLTELNEKLLNYTEMETEAADKLLGIQISNAEKLYALKVSLFNKEQQEQEDLEFKTKERLAALEVQELKKLQELKDTYSEEEYERQVQAIKDKYGVESEEYKKLLARNAKAKEKADKEAKQKATKSAMTEINSQHLHGKNKTAAMNEAAQQLFDSGVFDSLEEALKELKKENKAADFMKGYNLALGFVKAQDQTIKTIAESQTKVDTRLQGSKNNKLLGSYWKRLSTNIVENVGMNPFVKQSAVAENLRTLVAKGISFDVEQRAFLMTVKEGIADTFDAADGTLLKLVRIQQADTTAARLGMESALTSFLNNMYETTEYMTDAAKEVRTSLAEAEALMGAKSATAFEYQVQKWMGSLYSVGFGSTTNLSSAFGKLAAGDISGITGDGTGNLLVMAANKAGLSIADILSKGLDDSDTNRLMTAMVQYLSGIYNETHGSNILAQQYAGVFGLTASDLKAAANLSKSISNISSNKLDYNGQIRQLQNMYGTMYQRYSTGGMLNNLWDNFKYASSEATANDPVLYSIWAVSNMLDELANGIEFGIPMFMGTGTTQTFKVSDIMKLGSFGVGALGGIGKMIIGLAKGGGDMLARFGIGNGLNTVTRGTGEGLIVTKGASVSDSGYVGSDGSNIQDKAMGDTIDSQNQQIEAKQEESEEKTLTDVNESVLLIYTLLEEATNGTRKIHVDIDDSATWTGAGGSGGTINFGGY